MQFQQMQQQLQHQQQLRAPQMNQHQLMLAYQQYMMSVMQGKALPVTCEFELSVETFNPLSYPNVSDFQQPPNHSVLNLPVVSNLLRQSGVRARTLAARRGRQAIKCRRVQIGVAGIP